MQEVCCHHLTNFCVRTATSVQTFEVTKAKWYFNHDINGGGDSMYTADNICKMIKFLIDNIFVQFGGCLFCQMIRIPRELIVLHYLLTFSFTHMRTNF